MKKAVTLTILFLFVIINQTQANKEIDCDENPLNLKAFNDSSEVDFNVGVEKEWIEEQEVFMYLISMKNSTDKLLAIKFKGEKELTPILFININEDKNLFKDINNRKKVLEIKYGEEKI
jgi:hypothetical protein